MQKPISRKMHGVADYTYAPVAALAPKLFGFENNTAATRLARGLGGAVLAQGLMTKAEWGAFQLIPFRRHLQVDYLLGAFSVAAPWLFGFSRNRNARNVFIGLGLVALATASLTRSQDRVEPRRLEENDERAPEENEDFGYESEARGFVTVGFI